MILVNIFRSSLDDTHEAIKLEEQKTIKEVFFDVDFTDAIISVNGFRQNENYFLEDGDICTIRLFPEGNAGDWFVGLGLGLLAGLAVLNFWNPGGWAAAGILLGGMAVGTLGFGIASAAGASFIDWLTPNIDTDLKNPETLEGIP
jgi:hypothetical protein